jgi:LPXTG-motif cell wall-anchored protein
VHAVLNQQIARRTLYLMLALALTLVVLMGVRMQSAGAQTTGYQVTVGGEQASRGSTSTASTSTSSSSLPFTGSDVSLLAGAGVALVVLGGAVYITTRRQRANS